MGQDEQGQGQEELRARLRRLRGQDLSDAAVAAEAAALKASGPAAVPVLLEQFAEEDETLWAVATQALKTWEEPRPVEALVALLRNPRIHDLAKALVLTILERYGLDIDDPDVLGLGIDLEEFEVEPEGNGGNGGQER